LRKTFLIIFAAAIAVALIVPSFADEISKSLSDSGGTNVINESDNSTNGTLDNSTVSNSTNLTSEQIQTLNNTQYKLTTLIAKIESLKANYTNNTKAKGLLNALDQFEKQAIRLNSEISAFMQNSTFNSSTKGRINSFEKREAAMEHKVMIKEMLLVKMSTKQVVNKKNKINSNLQKKAKHIKKQKKNKGKN